MDTAPTEVSFFAQTKLFTLGCILSAYKIFLEPRKIEDEDRRVEFILNTILCGTILFLTYLECLLVVQRFYWTSHYNIPYTGVRIELFTSLYGVFISLLYLSRRGFVRLVSYCFIALYFIGTTYSAFIWGPYLYQVLLSYALLIVMTSILLRARTGFFLTILITATIFFLSLLDIHHLIHFDQSWKLTPIQLSDSFKFSITYGMIVFISWLSNREITKSLRRAHVSEKALKDKNESLERIVEERTIALQKVQAEKVSQLYRLAEFGKLSSGMFHDLMNPLTILGMQVETLGKDHSINPQILQVNIDNAIGTSKRIESFMESIRKQLSMETNIKEFSLNDEISNVIGLLRYKANQAHITIRFKSDRALKTFDDSNKFHQIILNILSNAIDASEKTVVTLHMKKRDRSAIITIRDKGCGIPQEHIDKIFDPFFTTKSQYKGMGLGLSNTKKAVHDLNGTISVTSTENEGTLFTIILPLKKHEGSIGAKPHLDSA